MNDLDKKADLPPLIPIQDRAAGGSAVAERPRCYQCGEPFFPGRDGVLPAGEKDGWCAWCIYLETGYFPHGMTPADWPDMCDSAAGRRRDDLNCRR